MKKKTRIVPKEMDEIMLNARRSNLAKSIRHLCRTSSLDDADQVMILKDLYIEFEKDYIEEIKIDLNFHFEDIDENDQLIDFLTKD